MTDYRREEFETDRLADMVARGRPRVTTLPDTANDIPLNDALATVQREAEKIDQWCECLEQHVQPCGACGTPPSRRE